MTCIAGFIDDKNGVVYLGGDASASTDDSIEIRKEPKVFQNKNYIMGCSGSFVLIQSLKYNFNPPEFKDSKLTDLNDFMGSEFANALKDHLKKEGLLKIKNNIQNMKGTDILIGYHGRLFYVDEDMAIGEPVDAYYAIGTGGCFAWASLYTSTRTNKKLSPKGRVKLSLETAARYSLNVRGPFTIISK